jgi:hypothetical protein
MKTFQLALGSACLVVLQACSSTPPTHFKQRLSLFQPASATQGSSECPPLFGKVCYGPSDRPDTMRCGCSTVSPLGTPYP